MKAISIRQPYAHEILLTEKKYEFRTWTTKHRGDLLICSSASPKIPGTISGHALAVCELSDITLVTKNNYKKFDLHEDDIDDNSKLYAWHLTNLAYIYPFKVRGKLNLYEVDDSLIKYIEDEKLTKENATETFNKYFVPFMHKG